MRKIDGFFVGLRDFLNAMKMCFDKNQLGAWYKKAVIKSIILSVCVLTVLIIASSFGIFSLISGLIAHDTMSMVASWLGSIIVVLLMLWFSGAIASALLSVFVGFVVNEKELFEGVRGKVVYNGKLQKARFKDLRKEYFAIGVSLLISILTYPFILFAVTIPIAIIFMGWAMGREGLGFGHRLINQGIEGNEDSYEFSHAYKAGLGLIPAAVLMIPILGWAFLPMLQVSGSYAISKRVLDSKN